MVGLYTIRNKMLMLMMLGAVTFAKKNQRNKLTADQRLVKQTAIETMGGGRGDMKIMSNTTPT